MEQISGREFYTTNEEMFHPKHTALLVIDMQNDFTHDDGYYGKTGLDLSMIKEIVPNISKLLEAARKSGVMVIYTQHTILKNFVSDSPLWLQIHQKSGLKSLDQKEFFTMDNTWGNEVIDELRPQETDIVIKKYRANAFVGTHLEMLLRSNGIESVAVTGQVTQGCVESAVRMARDLDFYTAMVSDGVASTRREFHNNTMENLGARMPTPDTEELCNIWVNATV